jgi:hypothetical protein
MMKKVLRKCLGVVLGLIISAAMFMANATTVPDLESQIDFRYENGEYCYNIENLDELISK